MNEKLAFDLKSAFFGSSDKYPTQPGQVGGFVTSFATNAVILAGLICVIMIVIGGFTFIAGAGRANPQAAGKGKSAIMAGLFGFVIIFVAFWIVEAISIITGVPIF